MRAWALAVLVLAAACGAKTTCKLAAPKLETGLLTVDGTRLRDEAGRVVLLRGVNMGGRSKFAPYAPFDFPDGGYQAALDAYLDRAQGWGIDVARVPFTWEAVEPVQGQDDAEFLARYDALLDGLWKRGIRSVVDFHQDVYSDVYCGDGFPAWTLPGPTPAPHHDCPAWGAEYLTDSDVAAAFDRFWDAGSGVQDEYAALWGRVAKRYADKPGVIGFELLNEPGWGTAVVNDWEAKVLPPFFTAMAARVRASAPKQLVVFEGAGSDGVTVQSNLGRPMGEGLVFAPHYYPFTPSPAAAMTDLQKWAAKGRGWNVPVLVGEFGLNSGAMDPVDVLKADWDALEALGLGGTQWEYSVSSELWNSERFGLVEADGTEDPTVAALVRPYLRALAGTNVAVTREASGRVSWSYTGAKGVTEIAVPARTVPNGYDVEVVGACADQSQPGMLLVQAEGEGRPVEVHLTPR